LLNETYRIAWFDKQYPPSDNDILDSGVSAIYLNFVNTVFQFQYGVYVDFFDDMGYDLVVFKWRSKYASNVYYIDGDAIGKDGTIGKDKGYKTRKLARLNVIDMGNKIFNDDFSDPYVLRKKLVELKIIEDNET
jgi:hypothetical protein